MTPEESIAWRPTHPGGATDILPFYAQVAPTLPKGGAFVEIGSFFGRSLSFMGTLRPDLQLWAVGPWEDRFVDAGEVLPVGPDLELCREHGGLFPAFLVMMQRHAPEVLARTRIVRAPSTIGMKVIDRADMVFIDGEHALGAVQRDIAEAKRVVVPGGIIAGHDYCWGNAVTRAVKDAFPVYRLAEWPAARDGWDPGHSSVWWTRRDPTLGVNTHEVTGSRSGAAASVPTLPRVTVISTGFRAPTARVCRASVAAQQRVEVEHRYVEASEQSPPKTKIENLLAAVADLASDAIVALVDGDDWLAHPHALAIVADAHARGAWVTYGQFMNTAGEKGFASAYEAADYRRGPWRATHLKTFRAGLMQRIRHEDLKFEGRWIDRGDDPSFMIPILEMAGPKRSFFVPEILYIYNSASNWESGAPHAERAREKAIEQFIRSKRPYPRLASL
jgi:hypothetical protein